MVSMRREPCSTPCMTHGFCWVFDPPGLNEAKKGIPIVLRLMILVYEARNAFCQRLYTVGKMRFKRLMLTKCILPAAV